MVQRTDCAEVLEPEIVSDDKVFVAGRNWSSMNIRRGFVTEGRTIKEILCDALRREFDKTPTEFQEKLWLERCRCKVNGVEVEASKWDSYVPKAGEFVEFLVAPKGGGGGGGKNVLNMVLMFAVIAVAIFVVGPLAAQAAGYMQGGAAGAALVELGGGTLLTKAVGSLAVAATMTVGTYAVNKICPVAVPPQQAQSSATSESSPTYSLNGSSNSANPYGYVPLVLGRFRYAGPLGAKSWTKQIGDDQYFNMLVVWGHEHMTVKDFRIGETPLSEFKDVTHVFHSSTTGNNLKYFNKSYNEQSIGAALAYNNPVVRYIGECDSISVDISFGALVDSSSGETKAASVEFRIEYALEGTENWKAYAHSTKFFAPAQYVDTMGGINMTEVWCTPDGTWHAPQSRDELTDAWKDGKIRVTDKNWTPRYEGCNTYIDPDGYTYEECELGPIKRYKDKHKHHEWWFKDATYDAGMSTTIAISAESSYPITRSFEWAVPHGEYKVRVTRVSLESELETVYDDATWSVARAIVNQQAFNTPIPICCSELRIRASEQLSGYVSDFNALCTSRFPIYDKYDANGELVKDHYGWYKEADKNGVIIDDGKYVDDDDIDYVYGETVNPADHIRYLLTSRHALNTPYTEAKIDEAALSKFADYCIDSDYQFGLVCDSEAAAWNRLTSVAAAGRGAITTDNDGLFGVTIDNADKTMTQMFTPRNSWGFTIERAFYSLPHALRVSYYDEDDDYKQKEGFIYADGYNKKNATDIVEWSMTGKTRWEDNYRMGRYYLASLKLRPITVTLSTDWEWMMCRRGDVVGVSHDVLLNTFGTARIVALIYRTPEGEYYYVHQEEELPSAKDALPVGVKLDDTVIFSSEYPSYGIAVRTKNGTVLTYEIQFTSGVETADMIFANPISAAQVPYIGALASVSVLGNETAKYLVAAINVSDHNSAELTLVPWAMPEIIDSENGAIAEWEPPLYLPSIAAKGALPAPKIREIKSDETMLKKSGNSLIAGIGVWFELPSGIDPVHGHVFMQGKIALSNKPNEVVSTGMVDPLAVNFIEFSDVKEGKNYDVSIRLISDKTGKASEWTTVKKHKVVGRTSPPPAPKNISLNFNAPAGVNVSWESEEVLDFAYFRVQLTCGEFSWEGKVVDNFVNIPVREQTGEVFVKVSTVDVLKLESPQTSFPGAGDKSFIIKPPLQPGVAEPSVESDAFVLTWTDCETSWPLDYYEVLEVDSKGAGLSRNYTNSTKFEISPRKALTNYYFRIKAVDIFGNAGPIASPTVTIPAMGAPVLSLAVEGGDIVASWTHERAAFAIDRYVLQDAVINKEPVSVKGNEVRFLIPEVTLAQEGEIYETRPLETENIYSYEIRAIDIVGNESPVDEASIVIQNPLPPTDIRVEIEDDHLRLSWNPPDLSKKSGNYAPVKTYDILRKCEIERDDGIKETVTQYYGRSDTTSLIIPAINTGRHTFLVRTVDSTTNVSIWGSQDFTVAAPGKVTFFNSGATDNNVMLYYTDPSFIFFPIKEYLIEEIEAVGDKEVSMVVGRTDTHFFAEVRTAAEDVTYGVTPIDIAGNLGERAKIKISVKQPPDFVLYVDTYSTFNGERTYMDLDGKGHMYGPVPPDETWGANTERVANAIGKAASDVTWNDKDSNGFSSYVSPALNVEGKYVEIIDVGDEVPSTTINVTVTSTVLDGDPVEACKIEVSQDGKTWRTSIENGYKIYESSFRYIRLTFTWTGGLITISDINTRLDVKKKTDFGRVVVGANDNGDGWVSEMETPMLTGKWVKFGTDFIDVQSFPKPNVINDTSGNLTAFVVFEDVLNPTGFRVFVKDKNGVRQNATVDWSAFGV